MSYEEKIALENKYRDRFMRLFLDMVDESGYELGAIEMGIDDVEEVDGGLKVISGMDFYWLDEEEDEPVQKNKLLS